MLSNGARPGITTTWIIIPAKNITQSLSPPGMLPRVFPMMPSFSPAGWQAKGNNTLETEVGVGTFIDSRTGRGSALIKNADCPFVKALPNGKLQYTMPLIQFALCSGSYADEEGNIHFHHSTIISESLSAAAAAKYNGGKVMVSVGGIIQKDESLIRLSAKDVDYIIVDPYHEQAASIPVKHYWTMFVAGEKTNIKQNVTELK